jgi:hypothetical protein
LHRQAKGFAAAPAHAVALHGFLAELGRRERAHIDGLHRGVDIGLPGCSVQPAHDEKLPFPGNPLPQQKVAGFTAAEAGELHGKEDWPLSRAWSRMFDIPQKNSKMHSPMRIQDDLLATLAKRLPQYALEHVTETVDPEGERSDINLTEVNRRLAVARVDVAGTIAAALAAIPPADEECEYGEAKRLLAGKANPLLPYVRRIVDDLLRGA